VLSPDDTVDSLVNELTKISSKPSPKNAGKWQVVSKLDLNSPKTKPAPPPKASPPKIEAKPQKQSDPTPSKTVRKRKRKTHKLKWSFLLETMGASMDAVTLRQASDLHCACFFHAVNKREVNYNEVRNHLKSFAKLMMEKPDNFTNQKRLLKLINRYLNGREQTLPVELWSPREFKQCMSMVLEGNLLVVSLLQRRSGGKDKPGEAFAIPADEINKRSGSRKEKKYITREEELNQKYPIKFDADDIVICERYDSDGNVQIMNDENAKMLQTDLENRKLQMLIWAKEGAMHWGFVNFEQKSK